ncbi:MAG: hypothetical protein ACJ75S_12140 [Solirubrobacterales bacterium]
MAGASGRFRRRVVLLVASASLLGTVATAIFLHSADAALPGASSQRMLLRLHDLPPGYIGGLASVETGSLDKCDYLRPAEPQPKLADFLDQYSPKGCFSVYARLYKMPGSRPAPPVVGTGALDAGSVEAAEAGLAVTPKAISHITGDVVPEDAVPTESIGEETRLLHWNDVPGLFQPRSTSGSFLVWRSGSILGTVFVAGFRPAADDRIAAELAHRQQVHIEHPTPYTRAEWDDIEVPLDDPSLTTPVYWLGRRLSPRPALPALQLIDTASTSRPSRRIPRASLLYVNRLNLNHAEGVNLNLWSPRQWTRLKARKGELPGLPPRCGTAMRRLSLARGHALVYRGVQGQRGRCEDRRHRVYTARLHLGQVVITVGTQSICAVCVGAGTGSYDSLHGMETIVRGLRLRPKPVYSVD